MLRIFVDGYCMKWKIEYFEREDTTQPAEVFEDALESVNPKLAGKLLRIVVELQSYGYHLGGGYIEKCHDYQGMLEVRVIHGGTLAREFFGFDEERVVLLHGYIKRTGEPASISDLKKTFTYWIEYSRTRHVSPVQEEHQ